MYDPEAVIQDADIEMAEMRREGAAIDAAKRKGLCTHGGVIGYISGDPVYPIQRGLNPGEKACNDGCDMIFRSEDHWYNVLDMPPAERPQVPDEEAMCVRYGRSCFTCGFELDPFHTLDAANNAHLQADPAHEASWYPLTDKEYTR